MKKFERFIIYPMLFIALFFSFADDNVQQTTAQQVHDEIIAKSFKIVNDKGSILIELSSKENEYKKYGQINIVTDYTNSSEIDKTKIDGNSIILDNNKTKKTSIYASSISLKDNNSYLDLGRNLRFVKDDFINKDENNQDEMVFGFGIDIYGKENQDNGLIIGENASMILSGGMGNNSSIALFNKEGDRLIYLGTNIDNHGLINVFDKYGEDWRSYSYE
jgi:hypothetical protein